MFLSIIFVPYYYNALHIYREKFSQQRLITTSYICKDRASGKNQSTTVIDWTTIMKTLRRAKVTYWIFIQEENTNIHQCKCVQLNITTTKIAIVDIASQTFTDKLRTDS